MESFGRGLAPDADRIWPRTWQARHKAQRNLGAGEKYGLHVISSSFDMRDTPGSPLSWRGFLMSKLFGKFSSAVAAAAGHPFAFIIAVLCVLIWAATGPLFHYSENWQLVINTGTTIITFLMVFVIQNAQNREGGAIQAKLDELIRASASENAFIGIEHLSQEEVDEFRQKCEAAAKAISQKMTTPR
jgi:low affinity Fe/Cu permease